MIAVFSMSRDEHKRGESEMDENTHSTIIEFVAEGVKLPSRDGSRQDTEHGAPSSRLHGDPRGSALGQEASTGGNGTSRLLSVEEVASLLNVPRKWVYRRVGLKPPDGIPYLKVGKYLRFRESDLWQIFLCL
jgi:excisionase family DNA binding protein